MPSSSTHPANQKPDPEYLLVGQVARPHGVRGEVRIQILSGYPDRLLHLETIALVRNAEKPEKAVHYPIERARLHQGMAILQLAGVPDRDAAEALRDLWVLIPVSEAVPLEEGEYYFFQLIGLEMVTEAGDSLGTVKDILETGANEVYIVQGPRYGELLIPAIEDVIKEIDLDGGKIIITPMEGLLPD